MAVPVKREAFLAGDLGDCAGGGEIATEDDQVAGFLDGIADGADDGLALGVGFYSAQVFRDGLAADGHAIAVEEAGIEQRFHHGDDAADGDELCHEETAAGLEIGEDGDAAADAGEVVDGELEPGGVGHGDEVEHGVVLRSRRGR